MGDENIAMEEDPWMVWFVHILGDLASLSAPVVRVERLWNWWLRYKRRVWERIDCKQYELGGVLLLALDESQEARAILVNLRRWGLPI